MKALGLDVGSSLIKAVQLEKKGKDLLLSSFGWVTNPFGEVNYNNEAERLKLVEATKKLLKDRDFKGKEVVISLPTAQIYTRIIEMPLLSENELSSAISWEAEQYVPVPLAEVNLSWEIVSQPKVSSESAKMLVFLAAAPKKLIDNQVKFLELLNLEPLAVETTAVALGRLVTGADGVELAVQIGWRSTSLTIMNQGMILFAHNLNTGAEALTRSVSNELKLDFYQAEEYRRTYGFEKTALEGKVGFAMKVVFDELAGEIKRAMDFYSSQNEGKVVNRVVLAGGGALTPALASQLAEFLGIEVLLLDPLAKLISGADKAWPKDLQMIAPILGEAIGLAMREI
ncbi:pilus assembly protein PilM [Patescibacteria group bacterium]|nr:pilus assembly protein PilM [Patescibacteria group bacterium]MBU1931720.1 pilus assembly protein PilM [Patescibacteria group bacterium]